MDLFIHDYFVCNHALWPVAMMHSDSLANQNTFCSEEVMMPVRCLSVISNFESELFFDPFSVYTT